MRRFSLAFLSILLILACAFPALAQTGGVRIGLTLPEASPSEVARFQQNVIPVIPQALVALPMEDRGKIRSVAQGPLPEGIEIKLLVNAPSSEAERIARDFSQPLVAVATGMRPGRLQIASYRLDISSYPLEQRSPVWGILLLAGLLAILILAFWLRERSRGALGLPRLQGIPLLGTLSQEQRDLKSDPCLALGAMFLMLRQTKRDELAIVAPSGNPIPIACIGQALVKEGFRVLVVDRFGEKSDLLELFREGSGSGERKVMDILTIKQESGPIPVPSTLRENYDFVLHFVPRFLPGKKTVLVLDRPPLEWLLLRGRILALWNRSPILGLVLLGLRPPSRTLSRYQLRSHFERLRRLDKTEEE